MNRIFDRSFSRIREPAGWRRNGHALLCNLWCEGECISWRHSHEQSVDHLKKAIKNENEDVQGPARNSQLFLVKSVNGTWQASSKADVKVWRRAKDSSHRKVDERRSRATGGRCYCQSSCRCGIGNITGVIILYQIWGKEYHIRDIPLIWHNSTKSSSGRQVY